jgi:competence protein ComEC
MPFNQFPFLRYVLFFVFGVWIYPYTQDLYAYLWLGAACFLFGCYLVLLLLDLRIQTRFFSFPLPMLAYGILILSGVGFASLRDSKNDPDHLLHRVAFEGYLATVQGIDEQKARSVANKVEVLIINRQGEFLPSKGTVLLYHMGELELRPGDLVYIEGQPSRIEPPKNPGEFDYRLFLERQQVYFRHFVRGSIIHLNQKHPLGWRQRVALVRQELSARIDRYLIDSHANQIANALLLGQKDSMEPTLKEAYATAGAMHILAVSGLHVGIVYGFFFLFWKPQRLPVIRRSLFLMLVIALVWGYAVITGLSPSVLRAATMFTLIGLAQMKSRSPSIFNPLALSALLLVLYDPFVVHAVGFQLSYAALLGILVFQPVIVSWWTPTSKLVDYFWQIASVSLAAQLATFPLTLHYFNSFPTYFLFSNLLAIPAAFFIMVIGIPFLLFSPIPFLASWLGKLLEGFISVFNQLMYSIQYFPRARLDNLYMDWVEMVVVWLLIALLFWWLAQRRRLAYHLSLIAISILVCYRFWILFESNKWEEPVIYRLSGGVAVDWFFRGVVYSYEQDVSPEEYRYKVLPNRILRRYPPSYPLFGMNSGSATYLLSPNNEWFFLDTKRYLLKKLVEAGIKGDQVYLPDGHLLSPPAEEYSD